MKIISSIVYFFLIGVGVAFAQTDTALTHIIKPYDQVISDKAIIKKGLITVAQIDDKYFFELPDKLLDKDLLIVTRIAQGAAALPVYPGDAIVNMVIRFEKGPGNKLFLRKVLFIDHAGDSASMMHQAVVKTNLMPIIESFPIAALSKDGHGFVVNATDFILGDNQLLSFNGAQKGPINLGGGQKDRSYISNVMAFEKNLEIDVVKTYEYTNKTKEGNISSSTTYEFNTSIIELPEQPMQQRLEDFRVGYFSLQEKDFNQNDQGVKTRSYVRRWRLEPKPADKEKYLKGELVEPVKQIVFYIDPSTPAKWIPYMIQGVNDWNQAFEQAGFKNAVVGKRAPTKLEDSTWSLYDASHSAIVYKASSTKNAAGLSISDPRSGEILESHISWYHNIMQLLHDQYMLACAVVDPRARSMVFDDQLMGRLIRYAISHEVGHALGLTHNMAASYAVAIDSLRNKAWVEKNGITPSVMDYSRFNYVAQPEDKISEEGLIAKVGVYDCWAIEWGYRWEGDFTDPVKEKENRQDWTTKKLKDKRFFYIPEYASDPRNRAGDLSNDPIAASKYGIANLQRMVPKLIEWTKTKGESYGNLKGVYEDLIDTYMNYLKNVSKNIGGIYQDLQLSDSGEPMFRPVAKMIQINSVKFLDDFYFTTPVWLLDTAILIRTGETGLGVIGYLNLYFLGQLFSTNTILSNLISRTESVFGSHSYTTTQFLSDIDQAIWKEVPLKENIPLYRRNLQESYLKLVISYLSDDNRAFSGVFDEPEVGLTALFGNDGIEMQEGELKELQQKIHQAIPYIKDRATKYHLEYCDDQIERLWHTTNKK